MSSSMEAHYHTPHLHPFYAPPVYPDQYLASPGEVDFAANFLGGSSPSYPDPHEDYRFTTTVFHRGPESSPYHRPPDSNAFSVLDATGLAFPGNTAAAALLVNNLFPAEELALYNPTGHHQSWSWSQAQAQASIHGVVAPVPVLPSPPEASFLPIKTKQVPLRSPFGHSPDPPLPTPAAMAVLLNSGTRSDSQSAYDRAPAGEATGGVAPPGPPPASVASAMGVVVATSQQDIHENTSREKKHACTMCHKRFDRPSTLRKHLLVHTGEKAFVCDICGRRFGVASNLNRHVKRCALKPVNMTAGSPPKSSSDSPSSADETSSPQTSPINRSPVLSLARSPMVSQKRGSISSASSSSSSRGRSSMSPMRSHHSVQGQGNNSAKASSTQKRRRRAPSPSRWVPFSLRSFNLVSEDYYRTVSVPLAPVRRNPPKEERDSWDENVSPTPYHPSVWKGVLPGPALPLHQGLRGKDMAKMHFGNGGGTGTFMVSRLLAV